MAGLPRLPVPLHLLRLQEASPRLLETVVPLPVLRLLEAGAKAALLRLPVPLPVPVLLLRLMEAGAKAAKAGAQAAIPPQKNGRLPVGVPNRPVK